MVKHATTIRVILGIVILIVFIVQNYRQNEAEKIQAQKVATYLSQDYEGLVVDSAYLSKDSNGFVYTIDASKYVSSSEEIGKAIEPKACSLLKQTKLETLNVTVNHVKTNKLVFSALYFEHKCI